MLSLFPADAPLPAPLTAYDPSIALPDFVARVEKLRLWQQRIASGYVTSTKEEVLKSEFLSKVFGQALGYEEERTDYRQLVLEKKTNVDGTKPDGALGQFAADPKGALGGPVRAVVELKDARTLLDAKQKLGAKGRAETPVEQAFSYPSKNGASCRWVLVSNFVELRLYAANDQTRAEVFDFRTLPDQPAQLRRFFALLAAGQVLPLPGQPDAPLDLALRQRQEQEARISKEFYRDYRAARRALLDHLIEQNPAVEPLVLLGHTQKLLDRVIFICFCEDKRIIPEKTFKHLLDIVEANVFDRADDSIYRSVRGLFNFIDKGNEKPKINRFNGGLFAADSALDKLVIKDGAMKPVVELGGYDFASDLNVNILGHIFEQSLADLEAERARLTGQVPPNTKLGKRKQDGIFYTPDYITRYIVGQAVGGWLRERRDESGIDALPELTETDLASIRSIKTATSARLAVPTTRVQQHITAWEAYGLRLRTIRILDPACGSGAFLNEAFGYLLREGQTVNDALAKLRADQRDAFLDLDRHILRNNLYGVDLNPESVQISRLSLWLQTANPGRPLTALDHSIRTGNSLIADPAVAGDRAFDWHQAFPEVFADGGFDVVVGNPPYAKIATSQLKQHFIREYQTAQYQLDLYLLFIEKGIKLLNPKGAIGYIVPNSWMKNMMMSEVRRFMLDTLQFLSITPNLSNVFPDASVDTMIFIAQRESTGETFEINEFVSGESVAKHQTNQSRFLNNDRLVFDVESGIEVTDILTKVRTGSKPLGKLFEVTRGINPYDKYRGQSEEVIRSKAYHSNFKKDETFVPEVRGKHIGRFFTQWDGEHFISYGPWLAAPREPRFFQGKRLALRQVLGDTLIATVLEDDFKIDQSVFIAIPLEGEQTVDIYYAQSLLVSKLLSFYFRYSSNEFDALFPKIKIGEFKELPIKLISPAEQQPFIDLAEQLLSGHRALHAAEADFATLLRAELGLSAPLTGKLAPAQEWKPWSTALQKSLKRDFTMPEKNEWLKYHQQHQQQQAAARQHLAQLDARLDALVYQLYQLTPPEIALVEGTAG